MSTDLEDSAQGTSDSRNGLPTEPLRHMRNVVAEKVKDAEERARQSSRKRVRAPFYVWRILVQVLVLSRRDRCPQQAAGLSFQSVLSVVPALALAMAVFRATGAMAAESSLIEFLASEYLPLSREEISQKLLNLSENITFESLGLVGLVTTLFIAFITYNSLDQIINHIWRVERRRSFVRRLFDFYLAAVVGSVLVGLSLWQAARLGLDEGVSGVALSMLIAFTAIFLANFYLPNTRVRLKAALVGAAVTTVAFELAKLAFLAYVSRFALDKYSGVYGQLAAVPLCLVWIYWSWLMLLLGVEVSHSIQNLRLLEGATKRVKLDLAGELERAITGRTAIRVLAAVARAQEDGLPGVSRFRLAQEFALSSDAIRILTNKLRDGGFLVQEKSSDVWTLTRPPHEMTVLEVFDAFHGSGDIESLHYEPVNQSDVIGRTDQRIVALVDQSRALAQNYTIKNLYESETAP